MENRELETDRSANTASHRFFPPFEKPKRCAAGRRLRRTHQRCRLPRTRGYGRISPDGMPHYRWNLTSKRVLNTPEFRTVSLANRPRWYRFDGTAASTKLPSPTVPDRRPIEWWTYGTVGRSCGASTRLGGRIPAIFCLRLYLTAPS